MDLVSNLSSKEAYVYKGASLSEVENAMDLLAHELNILELVRRSMLYYGKDVFDPKDYGIKEYVPHDSEE